MFLHHEDIQSHINEPKINQFFTLEEKSHIKDLKSFDFSHFNDNDKSLFLYNLRALILPTVYRDNFDKKEFHTITSLLVKHDDEQYSLFPVYLDDKDNFTENSLSNIQQIFANPPTRVYPIITPLCIDEETHQILDEYDYKKVTYKLQARYNLNLESIFSYYYDNKKKIPHQEYVNYFDISYNFIMNNSFPISSTIHALYEKHSNVVNFFNLQFDYFVLEEQSKEHLLSNFNLSQISYEAIVEEAFFAFVQQMNELYHDVLTNIHDEIIQLNTQNNRSPFPFYEKSKNLLTERVLKFLDHFDDDTKFYFESMPKSSNYLMIESKSFNDMIEIEQKRLDAHTDYEMQNIVNKQKNILSIRQNFELFQQIFNTVEMRNSYALDMLALPPVFSVNFDGSFNILKNFNSSEHLNNELSMEQFILNNQYSVHNNSSHFQHQITHFLNDNLMINRLLSPSLTISVCHHILKNFDNTISSQFEDVKLSNLKMHFALDTEKLVINYDTDKMISKETSHKLNQYIFQCFLYSRSQLSTSKFKDYTMPYAEWYDLSRKNFQILNNKKFEPEIIENSVREISLHQKFQSHNIVERKNSFKQKI